MKKKFIYLSIILTILSLSSLYLGSQFERGFRASWVYNYMDINELRMNSDLVIIGTVTSSIQEDSDEPDNNLIFTRFNITIDEVILGYTQLKEVSIKQVGGKDGMTIVEIKDDPLMKINEKVLLFLKEISPNKYKILGGPQGRFIIDNGKIYSIGEYETNNFIITSEERTNGEPLSEFIKQLKENS